MAQEAADRGVAVTFGVLTTDSIEQAVERAGTKAGNKGAGGVPRGAQLEAGAEREEGKSPQRLFDQAQVEAGNPVQVAAAAGAIEVHPPGGRGRPELLQRLLQRAARAHAVAEREGDAVTFGDRHAGLQGSALLVHPQERNGNEVRAGEGFAGPRREAQRDELERLAVDARLVGQGREGLQGGMRIQLQQGASLGARDQHRLADRLVRLRHCQPRWRGEEGADGVGVREIVVEQEPAFDRHPAPGDAQLAERAEQALQWRRGVREDQPDRAGTGALRRRPQLVRGVAAEREQFPALLQRKHAQRRAFLRLRIAGHQRGGARPTDDLRIRSGGVAQGLAQLHGLVEMLRRRGDHEAGGLIQPRRVQRARRRVARRQAHVFGPAHGGPGAHG